MTTAEETHPYNLRETIPNGTLLLIVGTAPSPRFSNPACGGMRGLDFDFFYGSEDNYMWEFLDNIAERIDGKKLFEENFSSEQCCAVARKFLQHHKIWMHDVLQTYRRKPGREDRAGDDDIVPPPDAIFSSFRTALEVQSILKLAFTSERAAEWTFSALEEEGLLTSPEHYKVAFSQWRSIDRFLPIEEYIQRKFKQPFAQGKIANGDFYFYILPSPTARAPIRGFNSVPETGHL